MTRIIRGGKIIVKALLPFSLVGCFSNLGEMSAPTIENLPSTVLVDASDPSKVHVQISGGCGDWNQMEITLRSSVSSNSQTVTKDCRTDTSASSLNTTMYFDDTNMSQELTVTYVATKHGVRSEPATQDLSYSTSNSCSEFFLVGGGDDPNTPGDKVYRSLDAVSWSQISTLPANTGNNALAYFNGKLWSIGGGNGVPGTAIYSSDDGTVWTLAGNFPKAIEASNAEVFDSKIWIIGPNDGAPTDEVWSSGDGINWTQVGAIPNNTMGSTTYTYNGKLWTMGGLGVGMVPVNTTHSSTDGVTWTLESNGGISRFYAKAVYLGNQFLLYGGLDDMLDPIDDVHVSSDFLTWNSVGTLPQRQMASGLFVKDDRLYTVGGYLKDTDQTISDIYSTADGITWSHEGNFPDGNMMVLDSLTTPCNP